MLKKRLLLSLLSCITLSQLQAAAHDANVKNEVTSIGIFIDYPDQDAQEKGIAYDCITAIQDRCSHLFINPTLFKTALESLHTDALLGCYDIYDTQQGLVYMHSKEDTAHDLGIKTDTFSQLQELTQERVDALGAEGFWQLQLPKFFDVAKWQAYHAQPNRVVMTYVSGHGSEHFEDQKTEYCGSMNRLFFAALFSIAQKELATNMFAVKSSFWPAQRVLQLMQQVHKVNSFNAAIVTPMHEEVPVPVSLRPIQEGTPSFFAGCRKAAELWRNELTQEVTQHIVNTDTVQLMENQRPSVVRAGTTSAIPLA